MWYCCATALAGTGPSPKAMWRPAKASARPPCARQEEEISEIMWAPLSRAAELVSFANDKRLLRHAQRRLGLLPTEPEEKPNMEEASE